MSKIKKPQATAGRHILASAVDHGVSTDGEPPSFSFRYLSRDYCISQCTQDEQLAFVEKMRQMSAMTWSELRQAPRHGLGYEIIKRDKIRPGIPPNLTPDVNFIAFRFCGKKAMVGFRSQQGVFHAVWFDRNFTVYNHGS